MQITTKYEILQTVVILAIKETGLVMAIKWDGLGVCYELEYWFEGSIRSVWLYENELAALEE